MVDSNFFTTPTGIAVISAGSSFIAGLLGAFISSLTLRATHRQRIEADENLAERKFDFDRQLSSGKARADIDLAERKFKYDRELHDHKRRVEVAEQALVAFYEARDVFARVRSRGIFGNEGNSRASVAHESPELHERRSTYFIPIERLAREKELFARLQSLRYAFGAQFGLQAVAPFSVIAEAHNEIRVAAEILIQQARADDAVDFRRDNAGLLDALGWGRGSRPDEMDRKIDRAVDEIEDICRPVLSSRPE